jgi:hypothetical protein
VWACLRGLCGTERTLIGLSAVFLAIAAAFELAVPHYSSQALNAIVLRRGAQPPLSVVVASTRALGSSASKHSRITEYPLSPVCKGVVDAALFALYLMSVGHATV